jgi:lipopolysaccharide assembly outer membrane protein LptD (OstA)
MSKIGYSILFLLLVSFTTQAQNPPIVDSNSKLIEFLSAESYNVKKIDSVDYLILVGNVKIRQGKTLLYGDSLILNTSQNTLEGFGNVHILSLIHI